MFVQVFGRFEVEAARMSRRGAEGHVFRHGGVRHFVLNRARRPVRRLPLAYAAGRKLDVAAKGALIGVIFLLKCVIVIRQKTFRSRHIDLSFELFHQHVPAGVPRVGAV